MVTSTNGRTETRARHTAEPQRQSSHLIQTPDKVRQMPIGLSAEARLASVKMLNEVLADTLMLYHLYKRSHWHVAGHTFYQLHLLFDKHAGEQLELVDMVAERVQMLGGIAMGMPQDVVKATSIETPPEGAEEVPAMLSRLLAAHERILTKIRDYAQKADKSNDQGTNDLLISDVMRTNEQEVWFLSEHLVDTPAIANDGAQV